MAKADEQNMRLRLLMGPDGDIFAPVTEGRIKEHLQQRKSVSVSNKMRSVRERSGSKERAASSNKQAPEMSPELRHLREMIKKDTTEILQVELRRLACSEDGLKDVFGAESMCDMLGHHELNGGGLPSGTLWTSRSGPSPREGDGFLDPDDDEDQAQPFFPRRGSYGVESIALTEARTEASEGMKSRRALAELKHDSGFGNIKEAGRKYDKEDSSLRIVRHIRQAYPSSSFVNRMLDGVDWLLTLQEPKRDGCLATLETSRCFSGFFTLIIMLNAIFMVFQVNYDIKHPSAGPTTQMLNIDRGFLTLYTLEIAVKLLVHRLYFFWNEDMQWNLLDFTLVVYGFTEAVLSAIAGEKATGKATWMRSLRLFRIAKVLRILRVVKSFKELQLLLNCVLGSMLSMVWSVVMLFLMFYMFSLLLVQQTGLYLSDHMGEEENRDLLLHFGTVETCMWTLFKATFGGDDWNMYYEPIDKLGLLARFVWFLFIVFTQIALLNILTGIFVESALQLAEGDAQSKALKHEEQMLEDASELKKLCIEWDKDKSRTISKEEFEKMAGSEDFARYLRFIGLEMSNIQMFFDLICEAEGGGDGVDISTFVAGCMMLRGFAKSSDLMALMFEVKRMRANQADLLDSLADMRDLMANPIRLPGSSRAVSEFRMLKQRRTSSCASVGSAE